jgi:hypothetical protein
METFARFNVDVRSAAFHFARNEKPRSAEQSVREEQAMQKRLQGIFLGLFGFTSDTGLCSNELERRREGI